MNLDTVLRRFEEKRWTRVVAFGSSNTERILYGMHWLDWLELGVKQTHGRIAHFINAGLGGDTSRGLLNRFESEAAIYRPDVMLITIGGNDAGVDTGIDAGEFRANLTALAERTRAIGGFPVFQTYYSQDLGRQDPARAARFLFFMQVVRESAAETASGLIDHLSRWEPLRLHRYDEYQTLMINPGHVNERGNMVLGLDLIRVFGLSLNSETLARCQNGLNTQKRLDELS